MRTSACVRCVGFPCTDVDHGCYLVPRIELNPGRVSIVLISEATPPDPRDYYYAKGDPLFQRTTVHAFNDAGVEVRSVRDILDMGIYLTTAVKCAKTGYAIESATIKECSVLLEKEIGLFPNVRAFLLMGDVAITAVNSVARRSGEGRAVAAGSTYKIRNDKHYFRGVRAFPSYLQAGPSFFREQKKRMMIAKDIRAALRLVR
jgi:uracil-DNA glycosylase